MHFHWSQSSRRKLDWAWSSLSQSWLGVRSLPQFEDDWGLYMASERDLGALNLNSQCHCKIYSKLMDSVVLLVISRACVLARLIEGPGFGKAWRPRHRPSKPWANHSEWRVNWCCWLLWENHGKPWENHGKTIGKPWQRCVFGLLSGLRYLVLTSVTRWGRCWRKSCQMSPQPLWCAFQVHTMQLGSVWFFAYRFFRLLGRTFHSSPDSQVDAFLPWNIQLHQELV